MAVRVGAIPGCVPAAVLLFAIVSIASTDAQIYSWRDEKGTLTLSNRPRPGASLFEMPIVPAQHAPVAVPDLVSAQPAPVAVANPLQRIDDLIVMHARQQGVRPDLVRAVVQVESAFDPSARSRAGALGLMQLMPATAQQFGVKNLLNPRENVRAGVAYLRHLLDRYNDNEKLALAAYNAGPGAVDKYGKRIPPYPETQNYVKKVNRIASQRTRANKIYRVRQVINGREVMLYTDKEPE